MSYHACQDAEAYLAGLKKQQAEDSPSPLSEAVQTSSPKLVKARDVTPEKISPPKPDKAQSPAPAASCSPEQVEPTLVDPYLDTASDGPATRTTPERYTMTLASLGLDQEVEETGSLTPTEMEVDEAALWKTHEHVSYGDVHEGHRLSGRTMHVHASSCLVLQQHMHVCCMLRAWVAPEQESPPAHA